MSRRLLSPLGLIVVYGLVSSSISGTVSAQNTFRLTVPTQPNVSSRAVVTPQRLVIVDQTGQRTVYQREPNLDNALNTLHGYVSPLARQAIRWPVSNRGQFFIGDPLGLNWRPSAMTIQPNRLPVGPVPGPNPLPIGPVPGVGPAPGMNPLPNNPVAAPAGPQLGTGLMPHPVVHPVGNTMGASWVDAQGQLLWAVQQNGQWNVNPIPLRQPLPPATPIEFAVRPGSVVPTFFAIDPRGQLISIDPQGNVLPLAGLTGLRPGTGVAVDPLGSLVAVVNDRGQLVGMNLTTGQPLIIDRDPSRFLPGTPLVFTNRNAPAIYAIDRQGTLQRYVSQSGVWTPPIPVHSGLIPGGQLAYSVWGNDAAALASVGGNGQVVLLRGTRAGFNPVAAPQGIFPPGAPLSLVNANGALHLSGVATNGRWMRFWNGGVGPWQQQAILPGFARHTPVHFLPGQLAGVVVDPSGRVVFSSLVNNAWNSVLLAPGFVRPPQIATREIVPNPGLPPVPIVLANSSEEELVVQFYDQTQTPHEVRIPPRGQTTETVNRDNGATLVETYSEWTPAGWVEQTRELPIPPDSLQTVVVYANRTTYRYIDRRKNRPAGALGSFDLQSPVSLGVFDLPPGPLLRPGMTFDAYQLARVHQNPGGARFFAPPNSLPQKPATEEFPFGPPTGPSPTPLQPTSPIGPALP